MAELNLIHWQGANVLRASPDPFKVAAIQPIGGLIASEVLGPRYQDSDSHQAYERSKRFIEFANMSGAHLVLAPEYSIPPSFISDILTTRGDLISDGVVYILPMSSMPLGMYDAIGQCQSSTVDVKMGGISRETGRDSVNVCAILTRTGSTIQAVLQGKVMAAELEESNMASGNEVFVVEGAHMCLSVATCADLNDATNQKLWHDALSSKSGGILCHPQWNPAPDFQAYEAFWREALGHEDGEKRMIFSLNWARGSTIQTESETASVEWSRSKVLRGRVLDTSGSLKRRLSRAGMTVHNWAPGSGSKKRYEVWHAADFGDNVWIWDFVRPFTNQTEATRPRREGLREAFFERWDHNRSDDTNFDVLEQTSAFWEALAVEGVRPQICPNIERASSWEIDRFCSACRIKNEDEWLEVDPTGRPSSPLDCTHTDCIDCHHNGRYCSRNRTARYEAITYTAVCIQVFADASVTERGALRLSPVELYPLNLEDYNGRPAGWLLHGRGRMARDIEHDAARLIGKLLMTAESPIQLMIFEADGEVDPERIYQRNIDGDETGTQDILNPDHGRELMVTRLERRTVDD